MTIIDDWLNTWQPASLLASARRMFGLAFLAAASAGILYAVLNYLDPDLNLIASMFSSGPQTFFWTVIHLVATLPLILIGTTILSPSRRVLVFLRRFKSHSNVVVSDALASRVIWRYRTVTLDDEHYPSRGVPLGPQSVIWVATASVLALSVVLYWRAERAAIGSELVEINPGVYLATILFWPFFIGMVTFVLAANFTRVRRRTRLYLRSRSALGRLQYRMRSSKRLWQRSLLMSGHSTVVAVPDPLWQGAVATALLEADVAIIDISEPSDSICWEVEQAQALRCKMLLIANRRSLESWVRANNGAVREHAGADASAAAVRLLAAIGEHPVLAYVVDSDDGGDRFRQNLGRALADVTSDTGSQRSLSAEAGWRERIADVAFYTVLVLVVIGWPVLMVDMVFAFTLPYQTSNDFFEWKQPIGLSAEFYAAVLGPIRSIVLSGGLGHLVGRLVP